MQIEDSYPDQGLFRGAILGLMRLNFLSAVALALSAAKPRDAYIRTKSTIDRTVGVVLGILGVKLLLPSR
jgi:threonine/homoserine/homoserine lactone efflux protein